MFLPHCSICSVKQDSHINFRRRVQLKDSRKRSVPRKINITIEIQINTVNQYSVRESMKNFGRLHAYKKRACPILPMTTVSLVFLYTLLLHYPLLYVYACVYEFLAENV